MSITSILVVAMGSALLIASHALPTPQSLELTTQAGIDATSRMIRELRYALNFVERSSTAVEFTVADRDNDATPETIRYAWSGTLGDPLTRQYNAGVAVNVAADVYEFDLVYDTKVVIEQIPTTIESSATELIGHLTPNNSGRDALASTDWIGQYFQPALPPDALRWSVTRVLFMAREHGPNNGQTLVQLRTAQSSSIPTTTVLEQNIMYEADLSSSFWPQQFNFNLTDLYPGEGLCLVLQWGQGKDSADIQYDSAGGSGGLSTHDAGANWTYRDSASMLYSVTGKYTSNGPALDVDTTYLTGVRIALRIGADASARVDAAARILNSHKINP
jgi:hypothetical protein